MPGQSASNNRDESGGATRGEGRKQTPDGEGRGQTPDGGARGQGRERRGGEARNAGDTHLSSSSREALCPLFRFISLYCNYRTRIRVYKQKLYNSFYIRFTKGGTRTHNHNRNPALPPYIHEPSLSPPPPHHFLPDPPPSGPFLAAIRLEYRLSRPCPPGSATVLAPPPRILLSPRPPAPPSAVSGTACQAPGSA